MSGQEKPDIMPDLLAPELVPVPQLGGEAQSPLQLAVDAGGLSLAGLLDDALFGDVIDISDLLPRVLSPAAGEPAVVPPVLAGEPLFGDAVVDAAGAGHALSLTILYDDDILASDGGIL